MPEFRAKLADSQLNLDHPVWVDVLDGYDVGIIEARCGTGFAAEPLVEIGVLGVVRQQHLQRNCPVDGGVVGTPHLTHPTAAQQLNQLIATKRRALHRLTITAASPARPHSFDARAELEP